MKGAEKTEIRIENGEYVLSERGRIEQVEGDEETLQRIAMRLRARRGSFPPQPDYGSRLWTLGRLKGSQRENAARQYIAEALRDEEGVEIESVSCSPRGDVTDISLALSLGGTSREINISI